MKTVALFKQAASVTSTATITLGAAIDTYRTLAQVIAAGDLAVNDTGLAICVRNPATGAFEFGTYTVTNGTTLTRITVEESSNADAAVAFGGATVEVYSALPPSYLNGTPLTDVLAANPAGTLTGTDVLMVARGANLFGTTLNAIAAAVASINGGTAPATPTVTSVSVSPATVSLAGAGTQTFTAAVAGTNNPAQTVTWAASAGSITSGGVFTAPAATGSTQTITITATSTVDTSKSGTATVTIGAISSTVSGVTVSPATANVAGGAQQTFTASVAGTNSPSQTVNWSASAGTITAGGVFTAPAATSSAQTITITATSAQDNTKTGTATVTVAAAAATNINPAGYVVRIHKPDGVTLYDGGAHFPSNGDSNSVLAGTAPNGLTRDGALCVYILNASNVAPAGGVKFVWSKSSTVPPIAYADTSIPANSVNGNSVTDTRSVCPAGHWGTWSATDTIANKYYGGFTGGNAWVFGTAGTYYLWAITDDGNAAVYTDGTGSPIGWTVTGP